MKISRAFVLTFVLGISGSTLLLHADDATTQPTKTEKKAKSPRLIAPYSKLDGLTDEQKEKIVAIHKQELEDRKKLEAKEADDVKAILTDDQKTQLDTLLEDTSAKRKSKTADKSPDTATTQPTNGM